jgi:hypothetical protein
MNFESKPRGTFRFFVFAALILLPASLAPVMHAESDRPAELHSGLFVPEANAPEHKDNPAMEHLHIADTVAGERALEAFTLQLTNALEAWGKQSGKSAAGQNTIWRIAAFLLLGMVVLARFIPRFATCMRKRAFQRPLPPLAYPPGRRRKRRHSPTLLQTSAQAHPAPGAIGPQRPKLPRNASGRDLKSCVARPRTIL